MSYTAGLLCLISASAFDEDCDTGLIEKNLAIGECINSVATVMPLFVFEET